MAPSDEELVPQAIARLYDEYAMAKESASLWTAQEKRLKHRLLLALGYDPEDPKPAALTAVNTRGDHLFQVAVSYRRGLDISYLREKYPAIYAECEKSTPAKSIKPADH